MLEPYVLKDTRTVLRRGGESNFSNLSDNFFSIILLIFFQSFYFQKVFKKVIWVYNKSIFINIFSCHDTAGILIKSIMSFFMKFLVIINRVLEN